MKKGTKKSISVMMVLALAIGLGGCGGKTGGNANSSSVKEPFDKYDPPITITTMMNEDNLAAAPTDYTLEDNPFVDLYKEYGINVEYALSGSASDLGTKLNMAITANKLPDIMMVSSAQFMELSEAGLLADLTEIWDTFASDEVKARYQTDGGVMMQNGYIDGKLYGLVSPAEYYDYIGMVAIRSDWMEECGMKEPETMEDLWNIAKTFKDKKMGGTCTIGIGMQKDVLNLLTPTVSLLNGYHAYTNVWLEENGKLVNSNIQPEMKNALSELSKKFSEGLIDPEFGSKDGTKVWEDALSGKSGVVMSDFCAPFNTTNGAKNGQQWAYYAIPSCDGEMVRYQANVAFTGALCVSANCKNPEALVKMLNLFVKATNEDPELYSSNAVNNFAYPAIIYVANKNVGTHETYMKYLKDGQDPIVDTEGTEYVTTVENAEKYRLNGDMDGFINWSVFGENGTEAIISDAVRNDAYLISAYTGATTEKMAAYNPTLNTLTEQMITEIIMGTKKVEYFDEYVSAWKSNGGDEITKEINEWYKSQESK